MNFACLPVFSSFDNWQFGKELLYSNPDLTEYVCQGNNLTHAKRAEVGREIDWYFAFALRSPSGSWLEQSAAAI